MHPAAQHFIERIGLMLEADGLARSAGRIVGLLLLSEEPVSLDDLAERLQVSKASVSTNARLLEQLGVVEKATHFGDRRDYYHIAPNAWERMLQTARRRWEAMRQVMLEGAESLPEEMEVGRGRLAEAARLHELLIDGADELVARWAARRNGRVVPAG